MLTLGSLSLGGFTVGMLSVFISYANQYTKPFNEVSNVVTQMQNAFASAARVFEVIDQPAEERAGSRRGAHRGRVLLLFKGEAAHRTPERAREGGQ